MTKIISWNVNGLRAILKKNFFDFLKTQRPDILCVQETKTAQPLPLNLDYVEFWQGGERAGYSGVLTLVKKEVAKNWQRFNLPTDKKYELLQREGRVVAVENNNLILFNVYFPNGGTGEERLNYKCEFYQQFLLLTQELLAQQKHLIVCGDANTAHEAIDLARPKQNEKNTGFLPWERAWVSDYLATGMVDVWRARHENEIGYTWWDYKTAARARNVGWRIDYFFCDVKLFARVTDCAILGEVLGSDHAPVALTFN